MSKAEILEDLNEAIEHAVTTNLKRFQNDQTRLINYVSASLGYFKEDGISHKEIRDLVVEHVTQ